MKRFHLLFTLLSLLFLSLPAYSSPQEKKLASISFINVGEGDSILVQSADESALIDSGNLVTGFAVYQYLEKKTVRKLKALIITHPHLDHAGGAFFIAQALKPQLFADNGEPLDGYADNAFRWYDNLRHSSSNYRQLKKGDLIKIGNATLSILWPPYPAVTKDWNSDSLVIKLIIADFTALLMGDANIETEKDLLESGTNLQADLLKVGHHGAADASGASFLKAVGAKSYVVSVDSGNVRGYPDAEVIKRIRQSGTVYMTSELGSIQADIYPNGRHLIASRGKSVK